MGSRTSHCGPQALAALGAALLVMAAACGDDDTEPGTAACDRVDDVEAAFRDVEDVDVSEDGFEELGAALDDLGDEVEALVDEAGGRLEDDADAVSSAVDDLVTAVEDAGDAPSVGEAVTEIEDGIGEVETAVDDLVDEAQDGC